MGSINFQRADGNYLSLFAKILCPPLYIGGGSERRVGGKANIFYKMMEAMSSHLLS